MKTLSEAAAAALSTETYRTRFSLRSEVEPSVLPRVLEPFALRNLVPESVNCRRERGAMAIEVVVAGLGIADIEHLTLRLSQIVPIRTVMADQEVVDQRSTAVG